jgi:SAM-dependent methyltransferase
MKTPISDLTLGIDTEGYIELDNKPGYANYEPTPYSMLERLFTLYPFTEDSCFADFGCGLGRAVFSAAYFGCPKVYGIEVNPEIYGRLLKNRESFAKATNNGSEIHISNCDARQAVVTPDMNTFFFFNPFYLKHFIPVLNRIEESFRQNRRNIRMFLYLPHDAYGSYLKSFSIFSFSGKVYLENDSQKDGVYTDIYTLDTF